MLGKEGNEKLRKLDRDKKNRMSRGTDEALIEKWGI